MESVVKRITVAMCCMNAEHLVHLPSTFPSKLLVFLVHLTEHDNDSCLRKHLLVLLLYWKVLLLTGIPEMGAGIGHLQHNDDHH